MTRSLLAALSSAMCLVPAGCTDQDELPPFDFESERARIGVTRDELAPCAADLDAIDRQVGFVEEKMRLPPRSRIDVFIMDIDELPCDGAWGCYRGAPDHVYSPWFAMEHELSHAAMRDVDFPSTFWSEGNAELLAGTTGTRRDPNVVLTPQLLEAQELVNYVETTHFQRYLVETRGWDRYADLVRGGFDIGAVYGVTAEELTAEYEAEAPAGYPPLDACSDPEIEQTDEGDWQVEATFSCADASQLEGFSYSGDVGAAVHRNVWLEAGDYEVRQQGGTEVWVEGCWVDVLDTIPETLPSNGDVPNEVDRAGGFPFAADQAHVLSLTTGLYRFSMASGTEDEATVSLTIRLLD